MFQDKNQDYKFTINFLEEYGINPFTDESVDWFKVNGYSREDIKNLGSDFQAFVEYLRLENNQPDVESGLDYLAFDNEKKYRVLAHDLEGIMRNDYCLLPKATGYRDVKKKNGWETRFSQEYFARMEVLTREVEENG